MALPEITNTNISSFFDKETIVRETAEQIMKDFAMFGVTITFSGNISGAYTELLEQLVNQVDSLMYSNSQKLMSVLYQIDISKRELEKTNIDLPHLNETELISHQIIVRELKKVLTRHYFKTQASQINFKEIKN